MGKLSKIVKPAISASVNPGTLLSAAATQEGYKAVSGKNDSPAAQARELTHEEKLLQASLDRNLMEHDLDAGMKKGKQLVSDNSLGRISDNLDRSSISYDGSSTSAQQSVLNQRQSMSQESGLSAGQADVLSRRQAELGGLSAAEQAAAKTQAFGQIGQESERTRRRMAAVSGATGVRGAAAAATQRSAIMQGEQQRADFSRQLLLQNQQLRSQALSNYENSVNLQTQQSQAFRSQALSSLEQTANLQYQQREAAKTANFAVEQFNASQQLKQREIQQFNLQQAANEKFAQIAIGFGYAQMGEAGRSESANLQSANYAADAARPGKSSGLLSSVFGNLF